MCDRQGSYDASTKTILVNIPAPQKFPREWAPINGKEGSWVTPGGCRVHYHGYGKGPAQAYIIQRDGEDVSLVRIIQPGVLPAIFFQKKEKNKKKHQKTIDKLTNVMYNIGTKSIKGNTPEGVRNEKDR